MRLLFGYVNQDSGELEHAGSNVFVRGLDTSAFHAATCATLRRLDPDVVVLRVAPDEIGAAQRWMHGMVERNSLKHGVHLICLSPGKVEPGAPARAGEACHLHVLELEARQSGERLALRRAEEIATAQARVWLSCLPRQVNRRVVLVGAGIVNLVIALHLVQAGYAVSILEGGPPPGTRTTHQRCTWSGGDGRVFSWNEARHHMRGRSPVAAARPFRRAISDGGWLCALAEVLTEADQRWIDLYEQTPAWLRDVYHDTIIGANRDSDAGWRRMVEECPQLFANVGFQPQLYRVYPDEARLDRGEREERGIGSFQRRLESLEQVANEIPCLSEAIARGNVGGALEVRGFGLNIHKFARVLLEHLQSRGVEVRWNTYAQRVALDGVGNVKGIWAEGEFFESDHFVVSPGVAGASLLRGSLSGPQLASMLGVWISLPRPPDLQAPPLKVCRDGFASDESAAGANVIAGHAADGTPLLHISSGHGFLGENVASVDERQVRALFQAVEETGSALFPESFRIAQASGMLEASRSRCIRPWTPTCLGLFETRPTSSGGVFAIAAGHNTGGFAQSPAVAQAVLAALDGRPHQMHHSYHPERLAWFIEPPNGVALALEAAS